MFWFSGKTALLRTVGPRLTAFGRRGGTNGRARGTTDEREGREEIRETVMCPKWFAYFAQDISRIASEL